MLYFLWGVFRARRVHNSESDSTTKSNVMNERAVAVGVDKKLEESGDRVDPKKSEALSLGLKDEVKCERDANLVTCFLCFFSFYALSCLWRCVP